MSVWRNLNHILAAKEINREKFFENYNNGQIGIIKRTNNVTPFIEEIAKRLDVDVYFMTKYNGSFDNLKRFPRYVKREQPVTNKDIVFVNDIPFLNDFKKNITPDIVSKNISDIHFEKKVPDVIFEYYDERTRNLRIHNEVENGISLLYCVKFKVTLPFKLYYVMYSRRRWTFEVHMRCFVKSYRSGSVKSIYDIYDGKGILLGTIESKELDRFAEDKIFGYTSIQSKLKKYGRDGMLVSGKEPEFLEEMYIAEKECEREEKKTRKQSKIKELYLTTEYSIDEIEKVYWKQKEWDTYD